MAEYDEDRSELEGVNALESRNVSIVLGISVIISLAQMAHAMTQTNKVATDDKWQFSQEDSVEMTLLSRALVSNCAA